MSEYVWVTNPKGRQVEVSSDRLDDLLSKGYKVSSKSESFSQIREADTGNLRIAFCNREPTWSGGDFMKMQKFAEALRDLGHDVDVLSPKNKFQKYDIVHSFNLNYPWTRNFMFMAKSWQTPFVVSTIHFNIDGGDALEKEEQHTILDYADALVLFSEKEAQEIETFLNTDLDRAKVEYIINGVSDEFDDCYTFSERTHDVLAVVNEFHPRKNLVTLARCCAEVEARLKIVGPVGRYPQVRDQVISAGGDYVVHEDKFVPHEELAEIYTKSKVVACVGTEDPFPNPVYEGWNSGCNLVVSENTYVDRDGAAMVYVDPRNEEQIQNAIFDMLQGKRPHMFQFPSWKEQAEKLVELYLKILND